MVTLQNVTKLIVLGLRLEKNALNLSHRSYYENEVFFMKKKLYFKRIDKNTGIESEIPTATTAEPIKDRAIIEGIKTALNIKKTRKYYALFCTGINTALRISDILKLRVSDVESGYVHTAETKTGKRKLFPINDALMAVLQNYIREFKLKENDFLFFSNRKDKLRNVKSMDQSQAYRKLKEVIEGLYPEIHFSTHVLRKTCAYWLYQNTKDIGLVMHALNQNSESVTCRYIGLTQEYVNNAFNGLNL